MAEHDVETELNRDIGLVGAIALGVGTMIAAGIFVLSGLAVSNVGSAAIVAFLLAALVASFTAFAYAEFASIYPESGGGYMYVANVFDTDLTYIVGWSMILGYPASAAFYLASFSDWFYRFMYPALNVPNAVPYWASGVVILGLLVALNLKGTEETGAFQILVTALKVLLILLFLYGGLQAFDSNVITESLVNNAQTLNDFRNIGVTSALVFITFFGFEAIATNAEEIEDPGRTVPRAIFISMGLVTVIYTLVVLVIVLAIHDTQFLELLIANTPVSDIAGARAFVANNGEISMGYAAQRYLGDVGFYVIIVGALFSMLSAANATILAGSRVKLAMARRDHLPRQFEDLHDSLDTPYKSVLLTGGLILFYIFVFTVIFGSAPGGQGAEAAASGGHGGALLGIEELTHFADFMLLGGLIVVNLAIIQSRRASPDIDRGFEVPGVPWVPIVAVLANLVLLVNVEPTAFMIGLAAEGVGILFWFGMLAGPSEERIEEETPTVIHEREPVESEYEIVVPIANPDHVAQLMRTADDIAKDRNGHVHVVSIVDLPAQTPLSEGTQYVPERREVIDEAMAYAEEADVPVSGTVRIGHDVPNAIVNTVEQHRADAVLMGWSGLGGTRREVVLGSVVDEVAQKAPADVLVEDIGHEGGGDVESILLPTAGGDHAAFAAEIARAVAHSEGATVDAMTVVDPDASDADRSRAEAALNRAEETLGDVGGDRSVVEADGVVDAIVEASGDHQLTVVGATREGPLQRLVFGDIPESVARDVDTPVIMAKRQLGVSGRLRSWAEVARERLT